MNRVKKSQSGKIFPVNYWQTWKWLCDIGRIVLFFSARHVLSELLNLKAIAAIICQPGVSVNRKIVSSFARTLCEIPLWRASILPLPNSTDRSSVLNSTSPSST